MATGRPRTSVDAPVERDVSLPAPDPGEAGATQRDSPERPAGARPCAEARRWRTSAASSRLGRRPRPTAADEAHRAAQRTYDEHEAAAAAEAAERATRGPSASQGRRPGTASGPASRRPARPTVEAAARDWLQEINRINTRRARPTRGDARTRAAATVAGRLERGRSRPTRPRIAPRPPRPRASPPARPSPTARSRPRRGAEARPSRRTAVATASARRVRGDTLVAAMRGRRRRRASSGCCAATARRWPSSWRALGGDDPARTRRTGSWRSPDLVDAILADAIEASALDSRPSTRSGARSPRPRTATSPRRSSSLGYRFDGLGGWVDGRVPSQRDLSLALGYAGLDPMRIRHWPTEAEMAELFGDVAGRRRRVPRGVAGDLTLGELVTMLGRRADCLAEVWNDWGRIRPLLLDERADR